MTDKEMIKRVDDLLYLERQLTTAICEAVKDVQRGYLKGRDTMPSDVYERLIDIIDETERLDNLRKEECTMKESLNNIEQNDFLDKLVVETVDDTLLNNIIIQKTKSFKTYNPESERDTTS